MKKIILLGDSIRLLGYGESVVKALSDTFTVWQPEDNCRFAKYTMRGLYDWRNEMEDADIIHWNNGLWDLCTMVDDENFTPIERYVEEMVRLAAMLQKRARVVIFATTTPVREGNPYMDNNDIQKYNNAIVPLLKQMGIVINDLYTLLQGKEQDCICNDLTHLSEDGIRLCAEQVTHVIRQQAQLID